LDLRARKTKLIEYLIGEGATYYNNQLRRMSLLLVGEEVSC
jgi:hypothetical protein